MPLLSADGKMLAVSTAGVVGDDEGKHADQGGGLVVYECLEAMFEWSQDPNLKMYAPKVHPRRFATAVPAALPPPRASPAPHPRSRCPGARCCTRRATCGRRSTS
jgi:hypothetical protein